MSCFQKIIVMSAIKMLSSGNYELNLRFSPRLISPLFPFLHFTSLHFTSLQFTSFHFTSLHFTSLHFTSLHFTSLHFTSLLLSFSCLKCFRYVIDVRIYLFTCTCFLSTVSFPSVYSFVPQESQWTD